LKIALKLFARKVFGATFFQKGSAVPTAKLGHSGIKFQAAHPDSVIKTKNARRLTTTVERTFFENSPKSFLLESFWRYLFSKRVGSADNQTRA
jgi:hypothetical protein